MRDLMFKLASITSEEITLAEKLKLFSTFVIGLAPIAYLAKLMGWWIKDNEQFAEFMCIALLINMVVGAWMHLKKKTFNFNLFLIKNIEMIGVILIVYVMLDMLRYTAGENLAGELFRILIQVTTLLYPTSKVLKNVFIITDGRYPPEYIMKKLFNFEKNGDLKKLFETDSDTPDSEHLSEWVQRIKEKRQNQD